MKALRLYFIFLATLFSSLLFAQSEGENDCLYSKEVIIPFTYSSKPDQAAKPNLNQTVFYGHRDQFTYWYKIVVKENALLKFKIDPLNDSDTYAIFVYQYNQPDFCNKVYYRKIASVKPAFFADKSSQENPYDLSQKSFQALKGNTYYISVLNTSFGNCGHKLKLINSSDTLRVKAVHIPCNREITTLSAKSPSAPSSAKKDTITENVTLKPAVTADTAYAITLACLVTDAKKNIPLQAKPFVTDVSSNEEVPLSFSEGEEWRGTVSRNKTYKIKCTALGYKSVEETVSIEKAFTRKEIQLEPLRVGDNFVMKSIYFYPNTYALKKESAPDLQRLLAYLNGNPDVTIEIQGHTNGDHHIVKNKAYGSLGEEWNFQGSAKNLSQKRAEVIRNYLMSYGVPPERLIPKGYGGRKPIIRDPQDNEEGQMNIRVEISILKS